MPEIKKNVSLKPFNTFGVDVSAASFVQINSADELQDLFSKGILTNKEILVLGGGSNMLFTKDYQGLVLKISIKGIKTEKKGDEILVTAGAGEVWNDLVSYCVINGYGGLENLTLIPGTVGASPVQNIGAYGVELKDVFASCSAFEIATGETKIFTAEDCQFGYRESIFKGKLKGKYIITSVTFKLSAKAKINTSYGAIEAELEKRGIAEPNLADVSAAVAHIRVSKLPDPSTIGNAGSFFKNPILEKEQFLELLEKHPAVVAYTMPNNTMKLAAGWLIEQCGFKGKVVGNTGSWKNQALVLVNHGEATGVEIFNYSEQIIDSVWSVFGVKLSREVNIL